MVTRLFGQTSFNRDASLKPFQRGVGKSSAEPFNPNADNASVDSATQSTRDPKNSFQPENASLRKPSESASPQARSGNRSEDSSSRSGGQGRSSLTSVMEQNKGQKISIESILDDFQKTMDAMGADAIRDQTTAYLNVVALEAQKEKPSVSLIKQVLRTAADGLDGYIKSALRLDKPSRVVREWVDALLMQPVEFQAKDPSTELSPESLKTTSPFTKNSTPSASSDLNPAQPETPIEDSTNTVPASSAGTFVPTTAKTVTEKTTMQPSYSQADFASDAPSSESTLGLLSSEDRVQFAKLLQESRLRQSLGEYQPAKEALEKSLALLKDKNQPEYEANVLYRLGKLNAAFQHVEDAETAYQKALTLFETLNKPDKKANVLYAMATLWDRQQNFDKAQTYYEKALSEEHALGHPGKASRILNVLGMLQLQKNSPEKAIPYFQQATEQAEVAASVQSSSELSSDLAFDPTLLTAIYNNLGAAYKAQNQKDNSLKAYQASLKAAQNVQDWPGIRKSLQRMASLYLDSGATDRAIKLLSWAQQIPA
jgi:tetratricopeptide (TPR) repeat protein